MNIDERVRQLTTPPPAPREPVTHDWRGRPYMEVPSDGGQRIALTCWSDDGLLGHGPMPHEGDRLILRAAKDHGSRYVVTEVRAALAEGDVHGIRATFDPRTHDEIVADIAEFGASKPRPVVL